MDGAIAGEGACRVRGITIPPEAVPPTQYPGSPSVDDAEFRRFLRFFNDLCDDANAAESTVLVIDAGRLHWKAGDGGEDSPCEVYPEPADSQLSVGVELQRLRSSGSDSSRQAELQLLRQHRESCCAQMLESVTRRVARGEIQPYTLALVTVPLLERPDDPDGQAAWLMRQLFDGLPSLRGISLQNQEVLSAYATGRITALVVNLGSELGVVAIWEGAVLSDTASVAHNPHYDLLPSSAQSDEAMELWIQTSGLVDAVEGAIMAAPRDTRRDLLSNIVITGGPASTLRHGWPSLLCTPTRCAFAPTVQHWLSKVQSTGRGYNDTRC